MSITDDVMSVKAAEEFCSKVHNLIKKKDLYKFSVKKLRLNSD